MKWFSLAVVLVLALGSPAAANELTGQIKDAVGGVLPGAAVRLINVASGQERTATADANGRYRFDAVTPGTYRIAVVHPGFSEATRTLVLTELQPAVTADFVLQVGSLSFPVDVTAMRGARDAEAIPLRTDSITRERIAATDPDQHGRCPPHGAGHHAGRLGAVPGAAATARARFHARARARRRRTAEQRADRHRSRRRRSRSRRRGCDRGRGARRRRVGAVRHRRALGDDQHHHQSAALLATRQFTRGSTGSTARTRTAGAGPSTLGVSDRRWAVSFMGGAEHFDDYQLRQGLRGDLGAVVRQRHAGPDRHDGHEFRLQFHAFPEMRSTRRSRARRDSCPEFRRRSVVVQPRRDGPRSAQRRRSRCKYQRRRANDVGFPDFEPPYFFQTITLPWSSLDKVSATYRVTNWRLAQRLSPRRISSTRTGCCAIDFPVQFPVPAPGVLSDQRLPAEHPERHAPAGLDARARRAGDIPDAAEQRPHRRHDPLPRPERGRADDDDADVAPRAASALGQRGPAATVLPQPIALGPPSTDSPSACRTPRSATSASSCTTSGRRHRACG